MQIKVKNKRIGDNAPVFIIAEIGTNHNGDSKLAAKLIKEAAKARVDAVKFQIVNPEESYQRGSLSYKVFKKARLDFSVLRTLKKEAERRGLIFFATPGDVSSLKELIKLGVPLIKISSGCMTNIVLLRKAAKTRLPIIMSTGMAYMDEVKNAVLELERNGARDMVLLHCVSSYPAKYADINLNSLRTLNNNFKYPVGYSDHTDDNLASLAAVSMGAAAIEKHFTLSRKLKGPEHYFSLEPAEFRRLAKDIRNVEKMLGSSEKKPSEKELKARNTFRRYLVFMRDLGRGSVIRDEDIGVKRLNKKIGLSPQKYDDIIGSKTLADVSKDDPVSLRLLNGKKSGGIR
ncbi:MAG: N-acetylneuraminate synthase family protein [Candidatus Omnitrophota bacterium]